MEEDTQRPNFIRDIDRAIQGGRMVDEFLARPEVQEDLAIIRDYLRANPDHTSWKLENLPESLVDTVSANLAHRVIELPHYEDIFPDAKEIMNVASTIWVFRNAPDGANLIQCYIDLLASTAILQRTRETTGK